MDNKKKDRLRRALRSLMLFIAALLLVVALLIPVINNFIAADVAHDLEALPLPEQTTVHDSVSAAGKLVGSGNGIQYFGALLLRSDLSAEQLQAHYATYQTGLYDCRVKPQSGAEVEQVELSELCFDADVDGDGWYILYTWGSVSPVLADWLNLDIRGH